MYFLQVRLIRCWTFFLLCNKPMCTFVTRSCLYYFVSCYAFLGRTRLCVNATVMESFIWFKSASVRWLFSLLLTGTTLFDANVIWCKSAEAGKISLRNPIVQKWKHFKIQASVCQWRDRNSNAAQARAVRYVRSSLKSMLFSELNVVAGNEIRKVQWKGKATVKSLRRQHG